MLRYQSVGKNIAPALIMNTVSLSEQRALAGMLAR